VITEKPLCECFQAWHDDNPYQDYFWTVWNNAIINAEKETDPTVDLFGFYRQAVCLILDFYSHDLAEILKQVVSKDDLRSDTRVNFLLGTVFAPDVFMQPTGSFD
jgi:hypothetical protein